jgi:hypothetical protein
MISIVGTQRIARDDAAKTIDVQVVITAGTNSPGIQTADLFSVDHSNLHHEPPNNCPSFAQFTVKAIALTALPLYLDVVECPVSVDPGPGHGSVKTTFGPLFGEEIGLVACNPQGGNLNNQACIILQNKIQLLRNQILTECGEAASVKSQRDIAALAAGGAGALFLGLAAAAVIAPWPYNAALAIAAAAAFAAALIAGGFVIRFQRQLNALNDVMTNQRADLATLVGRVSDVCCPEFVKVALDIPLCPS